MDTMSIGFFIALAPCPTGYPAGKSQGRQHGFAWLPALSELGGGTLCVYFATSSQKRMRMVATSARVAVP